MLHYIYSRSLIGVLVAMPLLLAVWGALSARVAERQWRPGNLALLLVSAAVILYATLFSRAEGSGEGGKGGEDKPAAALSAAE